jgi:hypothetical protein
LDSSSGKQEAILHRCRHIGLISALHIFSVRRDDAISVCDKGIRDLIQRSGPLGIASGDQGAIG